MITHWNYEICGKKRPDNKISVISYPVRNSPEVTRNLKYCNDRLDCQMKAIARAREKKI